MLVVCRCVPARKNSRSHSRIPHSLHQHLLEPSELVSWCYSSGVRDRHGGLTNEPGRLEEEGPMLVMVLTSGGGSHQSGSIKATHATVDSQQIP